MMRLLRKWLVGDIKPTPEMIAEQEASRRLLQQERGEFLQSVQRLSAGDRVMLTWENANRMIQGRWEP